MPKRDVKKHLRNLRVMEISPVPDGANEDADILIRKAKGDGEGFSTCADCPDPAACKGAGKCAIETPAKGAKGEAKKAIRKALVAAEAASEVLVEKAGEAVPEGGLPWIEVAEAALFEGVEKAALTFEEVYGTQATLEKLRQGVGALNQSVWSIMDDPERRDIAPTLIAKTVMQFGSWMEGEFDVSSVAKAGEGEDDDEDAGGDADGDDTAAGGSGDEEPEGSGDGESGEDDMSKEQLDEAIAKAKALESENEVLKSRLGKLEEVEAERTIEKAATDLAGVAPNLALPKEHLRTIAKQLDADGQKAMAAVLQAAGKQAHSGMMFGSIGKSGEAPETDEGGREKTQGGTSLVAKAKQRAEELKRTTGRA